MTHDIHDVGTLRSKPLQHDDGHQVPSRSARPPLSTTRATAPITLSFHDDKPVIPALPTCRPCCCGCCSCRCCGVGPKPSDRSLSITSTKYSLPNCSRGSDVDGRRSMRTTGRRSAARRSETVAGAPCNSAFGGTSRRIRALRSSIRSSPVLGNGDEGWFARI